MPLLINGIASVCVQYLQRQIQFAAAKKNLHSEKFKEALHIHTGKKLGRDERSSRQKLLETGLMR